VVWRRELGDVGRLSTHANTAVEFLQPLLIAAERDAVQCFRNWIVLGLMLLLGQLGARSEIGTEVLLKLLLLPLFLMLLSLDLVLTIVCHVALVFVRPTERLLCGQILPARGGGSSVRRVRSDQSWAMLAAAGRGES
jgi:hypothetical protein